MSFDPSSFLAFGAVALALSAARGFAALDLASPKHPNHGWTLEAEVLQRREEDLTRGLARLCAVGSVVCVIAAVAARY